jgi:hypothetical protein
MTRCCWPRAMVHEHPWAFPEAAQRSVSESTCLKLELTGLDQIGRMQACDMRLSSTIPAQKNATFSRFPSRGPTFRPRRLHPLRLCLISFQKNRLSTIHQPSSPQQSAISTPAPSIEASILSSSERTLRTSFRSAHLVSDQRSSVSRPFTFRPPRRLFSPFLSRTAALRLAVSNTSRAINSPVIPLPITPLAHHGYHRDGL